MPIFAHTCLNPGTLVHRYILTALTANPRRAGAGFAIPMPLPLFHSRFLYSYAYLHKRLHCNVLFGQISLHPPPPPPQMDTSLNGPNCRSLLVMVRRS